MNDNPLINVCISVITPCYNSGAYIADAIESVIAQSFVNWEMIIVDDCSSDNSAFIINQYSSKDARIKYFKTEGHYINYFCNDGYKSESFRCPKCEVEMQLEGLWFVRTHNRYLVNIRQIHSISNNTVILSNKEEIPISRAQLDIVKDKFQDYLRSIR